MAPIFLLKIIWILIKKLLSLYIKLQTNNKIMAKKKVYKEKRFTIHWYRNGFCYRTTTDCKREDVLHCQRTAKLLGESIKVELERIVEYEYTI